MTSVRRKNILEDYQEGYVPYEACFKFLSDSKFEKVTEYDYDTTTELTLPSMRMMSRTATLSLATKTALSARYRCAR